MIRKYWIKLYHDVLDDPKMGRLPDRLWRRAIEMFLFAGKMDGEGKLPTVQDMSWTLRLPEEEILADLKELADLTNILILDEAGWFFVRAFAERQAPMSKDEYMRRLRETRRQAGLPPNPSPPPLPPPLPDGDPPVTDDVTNPLPDGDPPVTGSVTDPLPDGYQVVTNGHIDIDIDIESDIDKDKDNGANAPPPPPKPEPKPKPRPKTRETEGQRRYREMFGATRYRTLAAKDAVLELEKRYGTARLLEAARWAAEKQMALGDSIASVRTALPTWGQPKTKAKKGNSGGGNDDPHRKPMSAETAAYFLEELGRSGDDGRMETASSAGGPGG